MPDSGWLSSGTRNPGKDASGMACLNYTPKPKDLVGVPWRVALALQADGWYLRRDIIWSKLNPMPESVTDRPSTAHEYLFLLTKAERYFYDADAVRKPLQDGSLARSDRGRSTTHKWADGGPGRQTIAVESPKAYEAGRNLRSVWALATAPFPEAHFATFPPALPETCIKAGTSEKGSCPSCGAPWRRLVEKDFLPQADVSLARGLRGAPGQKPLDRTNGKDGYPRGTTASTTTGWRPTCACSPAEPIPCTVLDPFNGAGTTGMVAARLGRSYVGIDLNQGYVEMARRRIEGDAPLLNTVQQEEVFP